MNDDIHSAPPGELGEVRMMQAVDEAQARVATKAAGYLLHLAEIEYAALELVLAEDLLNFAQRTAHRRASYSIDTRALMAGALVARLAHLLELHLRTLNFDREIAAVAEAGLRRIAGVTPAALPLEAEE
jgi:hypothetical protein